MLPRELKTLQYLNFQYKYCLLYDEIFASLERAFFSLLVRVIGKNISGALLIISVLYFRRALWGQMRFALIIFSVLLFSAVEMLAQSRIPPDNNTSPVASLDPVKRISQYVHTA